VNGWPLKVADVKKKLIIFEFLAVNRPQERLLRTDAEFSSVKCVNFSISILISTGYEGFYHDEKV